MPPPGGVADLRVVYTPLHGVAGPLMLRAIEQAGYPAPHVVAAQAEPDPDFPTVPFPNPEEPGALDLALADARDLAADLVLASDPDGDRLAVAVPDPGAPAAGGRSPGTRSARCSARIVPPDVDRRARLDPRRQRLVASTVVSSTLLSRIAAAAGVQYAETLTGFKWIVRAADERPRTHSYSDTKRRLVTRSATWCGTRTGSAPRSPCSAWRRRPGRPGSRCWTAGMRWRRRTGFT